MNPEITHLINATIITGGTSTDDCFVSTAEGRIIRTGLMSDLPSNLSGKVVDLAGCCLAPAYIDQHTHGACMHDAMDASTQALDAICRFQYSHGVGAFLPTTLTAPLTSVQRLIDLLADYTPPVPIALPGIHMEGPFLSPANRGAQPEQYLRLPNDEAMDFMERNRASIRLVTVSPELPSICRLIEWCRSNGIVVAGGHDNAIDDEIAPAIVAGLQGVTHIYCCSSTLSRRPGDSKKHLGLTELCLLNEQLYAEAIADNHHLPPQLLRLLYRVKGWQNICLVSDSIRATGLAPGNYLLGSTEGVEVTVTQDVALLKDGSMFAGSITPLDRMVQNAVAAGIPLAHAVGMASEVPARILGLSQMGRLASGCVAQLNLLDETGRLLGTI